MRRFFVAPGVRRAGLVASSCVAFALVGGTAAAQPKAPAPAGNGRTTELSLRRGETSSADAKAARGKAQAGDCAAALASFDAAIRRDIEPSLRRDRGLCHEKLGNPFPAIDDYRVYLSARPEAPDAEQIRQRLSALEEQTGVGGPSSASAKDPEAKVDGSASASGEASASVSIGSEGASASGKTSSSSASQNEPAPKHPTYDALVQHETLSDAANSSPLRYGKGVVLGPFVHLPRFFLGDGAPSTMGYGVGATFRYSTGRLATILTEIGGAGIGTAGEGSSQSGPLLFGGLELRLPVSRFASDHILLRGGVGFERYIVSQTRAVNSVLLGRFAAGFRHVFGPALGLEVLVDGGPAYVMPESTDARMNFVVGGSVAFVVGF